MVTKPIRHPEPYESARHSEEAKTAFVLAAVRTARSRLQCMVCELDEIGVALAHNMVSAETAVGWMSDLGALRYLNGNVWHDGVWRAPGAAK